MIIIIMGVAGCGKTTVGQLLGNLMNLPFYDADDYHPPANVEKMKAGISLTDEDRLPWLKDLANCIRLWELHGGGVLACSALKKKYRTILAGQVPDKVTFVHLAGAKELIAGRMNERTGHYMPSALLESQFADLEPPVDALNESIADPPEIIARRLAERLEKLL